MPLPRATSELRFFVQNAFIVEHPGIETIT